MSTPVAEHMVQDEAIARTLAYLESQTPQNQVVYLAQSDLRRREGGLGFAVMQDESLSLCARLMGLNGFLHCDEVSDDLRATWDGYQTFLQHHGGTRSLITPDTEITDLSPAGTWVTKDEVHTVVDLGMPLGASDSRTRQSSLWLLSKKEGISYDAYVDPIEGDHLYGTDSTPHDALAFLRQVHRYSAKDGAQHGELIADLIPLADEVYFTVAGEAVKREDWFGLAEMVIGPDIDKAMRELIYARAGEGATYEQLVAVQREANKEVTSYIEKLFEASLKVADLFSPALQPRAYVDAFLRGTLTFIHGWSRHEQNAHRTRDTLDLSDDYSLPVRLGEDEPRELLDELIAAIDDMHALQYGENTIITNGPRSRDYRTFRYSRIDADTGLQSRLLEYVRPQAGARRDARYEVGRPHRSIDASFDLRYTKAPFSVNGKSGHDKYNLSIRTDFDKYNDSYYLMSLDIGSIMGPAGNLGVRIGRFLAWCNQQRFRNVLEERPLFNHSEEVLGYADEHDVARLLTGVIAVRERDPRLVGLRGLSRALTAAGIQDYGAA